MSSWYCLLFPSNWTEEKASLQAQRLGLNQICTIQENDSSSLKVWGTSVKSLDPLKVASLGLKLVEEKKEEELIDWQKQWCDHSPGFDGEKTTISLKTSTPSQIFLLPGSGFGDFSHPTTQMMLQLMDEELCQGQSVLDIGSGSGILAIAAKSMGAKDVVGIDIDNGALQHARANSRLNGMEEILFLQPDQCDATFKPTLILMNMIVSEQRKALENLSFLKNHKCKWLISGILENSKEQRIECFQRFGPCLKNATLNGWEAFYFDSFLDSQLPVF